MCKPVSSCKLSGFTLKDLAESVRDLQCSEFGCMSHAVHSADAKDAYLSAVKLLKHKDDSALWQLQFSCQLAAMAMMIEG